MQIGKGKKVALRNGDEIHLLVQSKEDSVESEEEIGMIFVVLRDLPSLQVQKADQLSVSQGSQIGKVLLELESEKHKVDEADVVKCDDQRKKQKVDDSALIDV